MPFNIFQKLWGKKPVTSRPFVSQNKRNLYTEKTGAPEEKKELKAAEEKAPISLAPKGKSELAAHLIIAPHISEKANKPWYVFRVVRGATKPLLKKAIEDRYDVKVAAINTSQVPGRTRRRGRTLGVRPGFKKAIVALQPGYSIEEL